MATIEPCPSEVWTHPAVEVRPSPIAGSGLFATGPIEAGAVVIRLGGRLIDTAGLHRLFDAAALSGDYVDTFAVGDDLHLVMPTGTTAHFGNHACEPCMWPSGTYEIATMREVEAGEELTIDYGVISDDATFRMECSCGATTCRGVVTGEDWRNPDLQRRYAGHWPPGLQRRIDAASSTRGPT